MPREQPQKYGAPAVALATGTAAAADMLTIVTLPSFTLPAVVAGVVVVPWLLAACGDIEENPGPTTPAEDLDKVKKDIEQLEKRLEGLPVDHPAYVPTLQLLVAMRQELAAIREKENILLKAQQGPPLTTPFLGLLSSLLATQFRLPNSRSTSVEGDPDRQMQAKTKADAEATFGIRNGSKLRCMVLGIEFYSGLCAMGHITPHHWWKYAKGAVHSSGVMQQLMSWDSPNDPRNLMFCLKSLEATFDAGQWCVLCHDDEYRVKILDKSLLKVSLWNALVNGSKRGNKLVSDDERRKGEEAGLPEGFTSWTYKNCNGESLDGKLLSFPNGVRPARRAFCFHATTAITQAENERWIARGEVKIPDSSWSDTASEELRVGLNAWLTTQAAVTAAGAPMFLEGGAQLDADDDDGGGSHASDVGSRQRNPFAALNDLGDGES